MRAAQGQPTPLRRWDVSVSQAAARTLVNAVNKCTSQPVLRPSTSACRHRCGQCLAQTRYADAPSSDPSSSEDSITMKTDYIFQLNQEYGVPGHIGFSRGMNGMPRVWLRHAHSGMGIELYLHGATITAWTRPDASPSLSSHPVRLELSAQQQQGALEGAALSVAFPRFRENAAMAETNGFAARLPWEVVAAGFDCLDGDDGLWGEMYERFRQEYVRAEQIAESRGIDVMNDYPVDDILGEVREEVLYEEAFTYEEEEGELVEVPDDGSDGVIAKAEAAWEATEQLQQAEEDAREDFQAFPDPDSVFGSATQPGEDRELNDEGEKDEVEEQIVEEKVSLQGSVQEGEGQGEGEEEGEGEEGEEEEEEEDKEPIDEALRAAFEEQQQAELEAQEEERQWAAAEREWKQVQEEERAQRAEEEKGLSDGELAWLELARMARAELEERLEVGIDPAPFITLRLRDTEETRKIWPHSFDLCYKITVMEEDDFAEDITGRSEGDDGFSKSTAIALMGEDEIAAREMALERRKAERAVGSDYAGAPRKESKGRKDEDGFDIPVQLRLQWRLTNTDNPRKLHTHGPMEFQLGALMQFAVQDVLQHSNNVELLGLMGSTCINYTANPRQGRLHGMTDNSVHFKGKYLDLTIPKVLESEVKFTPGDGTHYTILPRSGVEDLCVRHPGLDPLNPTDPNRKLATLGVGRLQAPLYLEPGQSWYGEVALRWHNEYWRDGMMGGAVPFIPPLDRQETTMVDETGAAEFTEELEGRRL